MNFCLVFPEICRGHVHVAKKERRRIIIIRRRNGAKTISLPTMFGRLNYHTITMIGHHLRSNSAFSKFSRCLPFSKWLPKHSIKNRQ
jgi:hypothetical protein